jgi:hypothetical protein
MENNETFEDRDMSESEKPTEVTNLETGEELALLPGDELIVDQPHATEPHESALGTGIPSEEDLLGKTNDCGEEKTEEEKLKEIEDKGNLVKMADGHKAVLGEPDARHTEGDHTVADPTSGTGDPLAPKVVGEEVSTVKMLFPKPLLLTVTHGRAIQFQAGEQDVPSDVKDHPYLAANHVTLVSDDKIGE